jgi:hypothetical protein
VCKDPRHALALGWHGGCFQSRGVLFMFALRSVRVRARVAAIGGMACGSMVLGLLAGAVPAVASAPPAAATSVSPTPITVSKLPVLPALMGAPVAAGVRGRGPQPAGSKAPALSSALPPAKSTAASGFDKKTSKLAARAAKSNDYVNMDAGGQPGPGRPGAGRWSA